MMGPASLKGPHAGALKKGLETRETTMYLFSHLEPLSQTERRKVLRVVPPLHRVFEPGFPLNESSDGVDPEDPAPARAPQDEELVVVAVHDVEGDAGLEVGAAAGEVQQNAGGVRGVGTALKETFFTRNESV